MDQHLTFQTEAERQKALQVIEDLIQRASSEELKAVYQKQRGLVASASVREHVSRDSYPPLGPFPRG